MQPVSQHIGAIREDYQRASLNEEDAGADPLAFFGKWFAEAEAAAVTEVNAMTLATADAAGKPHARIVLLKGLDSSGFVFFSNYESAKGHQIEAQHHTALVFFWKELERQVRIEGVVEKISDKESDEYFNSRPARSRIGAWASPQSQRIKSRATLEQAEVQFKAMYGQEAIPRPEFWGGYRVVPQLVEFWQGRSSRLHDRIVFEKMEENWEKYRIAP